ncbi:cilia- and flagella-associated protein 53 [Nelusetta ayraudi]|uniref:cilia- and flagella-associated protein 53 n=1 Tax=Nelusetta ayraudi TaxID=303726 RepID=UPI003F711BC9
MQPSQGRRCGEVTGPTPHAVAVRAKMPSYRPPDYLIQERLKKDAEIENLEDFTRYDKTCFMKNSWLKSSENRFVRGAIQRQVRDVFVQQEVLLQEKKERLRELLEAEEKQHLQEIEAKKETSVQRQEKMKEYIKALRERREKERQQLVSDKLEQRFRQQCDDVRVVQRQRMEQQVSLELAAQMRSKGEQRQQQQQEERVFAELWEADRQAKEEREVQRVQRQQERNMEQLTVIKSQMEAAEQQRQDLKRLKEEEAGLMRQQLEMDRLQEQREQQQQQQKRDTRRRDLDESLRLKLKRLAREQQEELELDMSILQHMLRQETDEKLGLAQKKADFCADQERYWQYLSEELQRKKQEEEEADMLVNEQLREVWNKQEKQSRLQREARNRLMKEVIETQRLQIQQKLDMNKKEQISKEELDRAMTEMTLMDEEEKRRKREVNCAHQADLVEQIKQQRRRHAEWKAHEEREYQLGLMEQEMYLQRKEEVLSKDASHAAAQHPFRRADASRAAPLLPT